MKCTLNVTCLNHPETTPPGPQSLEKLSSTKPVLGAKKVGDHCFKSGIVVDFAHFNFLKNYTWQIALPISILTTVSLSLHIHTNTSCPSEEQEGK